MSIVALIVIIGLVILLVWLAQQVPSPWSIICYAVAVLVAVVAALKVLGIGDINVGHLG